MGFFKKLFTKKEKHHLDYYDEDELDSIEDYIKNTFGDFPTVIHELVTLDIHVDIAVIPPTETRKHYTLVTMGMGAHKMNVPKKLSEHKLERAEPVIYLPEDWKIHNEDEKWYWPIRYLTMLARMPLEENSWVGYGHSIQSREPFAENTKLCCVLLTSPTDKKSMTLDMNNGNRINFYQLFPIYEEEMNFKLIYDTEELLKKFDIEDLTPPINIHRKNYCKQ